MSQPIHFETSTHGTLATWILRAGDRGAPYAVPLNEQIHVALRVIGPAVALLDQNGREIEVTRVSGASSYVDLPPGVHLIAPRAADHKLGCTSKVELRLTSTPLAPPTPRPAQLHTPIQAQV